MGCVHDIVEMDTAVVADGMCPLCLQERLECLTYVMGEIARGRFDNGRPLAAETSRQMAREAMGRLGLGWPVQQTNENKVT